MGVRIGSADYNQLPSPGQIDRPGSIRATIVGSADFTVGSAVLTAYRWQFLVSASASALGAGVSAGGLDSLRQAYGSATAIYFVSDEAVSSTGFFSKLRIREQIAPTYYIVDVELQRVI